MIHMIFAKKANGDFFAPSANILSLSLSFYFSFFSLCYAVYFLIILVHLLKKAVIKSLLICFIHHILLTNIVPFIMLQRFESIIHNVVIWLHFIWRLSIMLLLLFGMLMLLMLMLLWLLSMIVLLFLPKLLLLLMQTLMLQLFLLSLLLQSRLLRWPFFVVVMKNISRLPKKLYFIKAKIHKISIQFL